MPWKMKFATTQVDVFRGMEEAINIKPKNAEVRGTETDYLYFQ